MVDIQTIVLVIGAFGPAFGLMFYTLGKYTYPKAEKPFFDDRKVFGMFMLGIVLGMIFFFVDVGISPSVGAATIILVAIAIPLLHNLIKLAILNWPKLQLKVDTAFYGLALGLGLASTYAFSRMYYSTLNLELIGRETLDIISLSLIIMMGVQIVFIQGATTALIGVGCARGTPWAYFSNAMIYAIGYSFLFYGSALVTKNVGVELGVALILAAWVVCLYAYWHVHAIDYPMLIDDAKRGFRKRG